MASVKNITAVVRGKIKEQNGVILLPIGRNLQNRKKMMVTSRNSKIAPTEFKLLETYQNFSYLELCLETGKDTHPIRVHMAHLGHPGT
ncbi:MAG: hypothetical protein LBJ83_02960 [Oscillospiraceae bacterium]|jgi:23S rRNA pseudouridine1911/1915/1917 synthase|nr:hypothetical protein [Oscillospiraceae bacterium]